MHSVKDETRIGQAK